MDSESDDKNSAVHPSSSNANHVLNEVTASEQPRKFMLLLPDIPRPLPRTSSRDKLFERIRLLEQLLHHASDQIAADYALKILMDDENGQLRTQLFQKKDKDGTRALTVSARLLTHEDSDLWNQISKHAQKYKELHKELEVKTAEFRRRQDEREREREREEKDAKKKLEKEAKAAQRAADLADRQARKEAESAEKAAKKKAEAEERAAKKAVEIARKAAEREAKAAANAAKKATKEAAQAAKAAEREAKRKGTGMWNNANKENANIPVDDTTPQTSGAHTRPRPRPAYRRPLGASQSGNQTCPAPTPLIDPQLLNATQKRRHSITEEGPEQDDHITKRSRMDTTPN